jgi:hypothetical protein
MIDANALAIHMNPLQEVIQLDGEANYHGILDQVIEITRSLDVPVVMKETGCGVACEDAIRLEEAGVTGIEVSGLGGTSCLKCSSKFFRKLSRKSARVCHRNRLCPAYGYVSASRRRDSRD